MLTVVKPAIAPLRVLLVGKKEEDFFLIREILDRMRSMLSAELEHAHSLKEANAMLQERPYGLVLFEHETGDARAVHLLADLLHIGVSIPYIVLTEHADEHTVAEIIEGGTWNCVSKSQLDGATLIRSIRSTLALHSMEKGQHLAEESLRKLSQAVEHSADTVMMTDCRGVIEYVNPAFEALTGYTRDEVCGKSPRILRSGEQGPEVYQELLENHSRGQCFPRNSGQSQKERRTVLRGREHLPRARWPRPYHAFRCQWAGPYRTSAARGPACTSPKNGCDRASGRRRCT